MRISIFFATMAASLLLMAIVQNGSFPQAALAEEYQETRIDVIEKSGTIHFYIKGVEKAQLTPSGLHVYGDITYTGVLRDSGHDVPSPGSPRDDFEGANDDP